MDIYKITNIKTGQFYIGKAINYLERWERHKRSASHDNKNNRSIAKNIRTYGIENFKIELLTTCGDGEWREVETQLINEYRDREPSKCLNILTNRGALIRPVLELTTRTTFDSTQHAADFLKLSKNDIRFACRCKIGLASMNPRLRERLHGYDFQYTYITDAEREQINKFGHVIKDRALRAEKAIEYKQLKRGSNKSGHRRTILETNSKLIFKTKKEASHHFDIPVHWVGYCCEKNDGNFFQKRAVNMCIERNLNFVYISD